jgi:hypothetical protein
MITISSNWDDIEDEIDRITKRMPTLEMKAALDTALDIAFASTQAVVHVQTGSLKTSGKKGSKSSKARKQWEGTIKYGGPSGGVNNPVDYAIYEKERDGAHDFFAPLHLMKPIFVAAISKGLRKNG